LPLIVCACPFLPFFEKFNPFFDCLARSRPAFSYSYAWVINKSVLFTGTKDSLLAARVLGERQQLERIENGLATRLFVMPWLSKPPVGIDALMGMIQDE
jgi:hypothetical protein